MVYAGICDRMPLHQEETSHQHVDLQTVKNSVPCLFAANDKRLWITYRTMVANANR